jgi:DNA-directed RNA polymerase specialized sigma24 family protein
MPKKQHSSVPSTHEKPRVDKQEAIRLRMLGYTYAQIAGMLGCSEIWCRTSY